MNEEEIQDLYKKGLEAYRRGELSIAGELLMHVVDEYDQHHRAWNALGVVFTKMGKYEDAAVCFENALILDPMNDVYTRNQERNQQHIKPKIKDYFSLSFIPFDPTKKTFYGIATGIGIVFIILIFMFLPLFQPSPLSETSGSILVSFDHMDDLVLIKNEGGSGNEHVRYFTLTGNNQTIVSPAGQMRVLGTDPGSTLAIPMEEIRPISHNDSVLFTVTAYFSDGTKRVVTSQSIPLPVENKITPESTPIPVYHPGYQKGDIVKNKITGYYNVISDILPDNQYQVDQLIRSNNGIFEIQPNSRQNIRMEIYERTSAESTGLFNPKNSSSSIRLFQALPRSGPIQQTAFPLYVPGDIITNNSGPVQEALVILGYDSGTDEYAIDDISQYASGEWGYRPDSQNNWESRTEIEQTYASRINRVALSQIGIGSTSSPPGTPPLFGGGDIIAKDRGVDSDQVLVLSYQPDTQRYSIDTIRSSYGGNWERSGSNTSVIRSFLEQMYPYKVRTIDVDLVTINR